MTNNPAFIASNSEVGERTSLIEQLEKNGIRILTDTKCVRITDSGVTVADLNGNGRMDALDYALLKRMYFGTYSVG